jgi:hypothetical protein
MEAEWLARLERDGFVVLPGVFDGQAVAAMVRELDRVFADCGPEGPAIRGEEGTVYAARNVLALWPPARDVWRRGAVPGVLAAALGPGYGLVRALYFDKPPGVSWALPWHKDLTVAVRDNRRPSAHFTKPTRKAGVPHAEAPLAVLERMLTARVHLDAATEENGPLKVLPGSHRSGKALELAGEPHTVLAAASDVLLMRPLLAHCSGKSHSDTALHRRTLHLEFAAGEELPDGYAWHAFVPAASR